MADSSSIERVTQPGRKVGQTPQQSSKQSGFPRNQGIIKHKEGDHNRERVERRGRQRERKVRLGEVRAKRTIDGVTSVCWREINHERNSPGLGRKQPSVVRYIQYGVIRRSGTDAIVPGALCSTASYIQSITYIRVRALIRCRGGSQR